ncbi:MAG: 30S ribosomal protein S3 [Planctomycetes bacterium]|nr:30S ribosomal protein S3 [Planctomycetota bacterium]
MGQKTHPVGFRIGIVEPWRSRWWASKRDFGRYVLEDYEIRRHVAKEYKAAGVPRVEIERTGEALNVIIHTARPGVLVGRKGARVDRLKEALEGIARRTVHLHVREIKRPELDAALVAEAIAEQLEKRASFRRTMKKAIQTTMQAGAKGIKVILAGRLGGSEMARTEKAHEGRIPLQTLRADVDYGTALARTTYGVIGVKTWIYRGDRELAPAKPEEVRRAAHA